MLPTLAIDLDPETVAVEVPPFPDGPRVYARFMRELSVEAGKVADVVEALVAAGMVPVSAGGVPAATGHARHLAAVKEGAPISSWTQAVRDVD
jgi:hypothetical protein